MSLESSLPPVPNRAIPPSSSSITRSSPISEIKPHPLCYRFPRERRPEFALTTDTITYAVWINGHKNANWAGLMFSRGTNGVGIVATADTILDLDTDDDAVFGDLTVDAGVALSMADFDASLNDVTTGKGSSIEAGGLVVRGTLSPGGDGIASVPINGEMEFDGEDATFLCSVGAGAADLIDGAFDIYPSGTLVLQGASDAGAAAAEYQMTVIQVSGDESEVIGEFDSTPGVGDSLGTGLFAADLDGDGEVVSYDGETVKVDVFQALAGDTSGDRSIDTRDLQNILAAGSFGSGTDWTWAEGDFNNDRLVNISDLQAILATGKFGIGPWGNQSHHRCPSRVRVIPVSCTCTLTDQSSPHSESTMLGRLDSTVSSPVGATTTLPSGRGFWGSEMSATTIRCATPK